MAPRTVAGESTAHTATSISEHLHEELLNSDDVEEFLDELARVAARTLSEPSDEVHCCVTFMRPRKAAAIAGSGAAAQALSEIEQQSSESPGAGASLDQVTVHVPDVADEVRWHKYSDAVLGLGIRSVLAIPFELQGETRATLILYSGRAFRFEGPLLEAAEEFAHRTSLAMRLAVRFAHYSETATNLRATLESRTVIDMAVGIIMAQNRCSQQEAFELLRAASSTRNSKLHSVAAGVVNALGQGPIRTHYDG